MPNKFLPFLLGHDSCTAPENCKSEIDEIFNRSINSAPSIKSDYVRDGGNWVIKGDRTDALAEFMTPDTNIYRVRKANKIRNFIKENHLEQDLMAPEKFIYWDTNSQKFFVIAEKVALSEEVASPASEFMRNEWVRSSRFGGQMLALAEHKPERDLTPQQAEALAKLSFLGYTDFTYDNIYFTDEGQVAIIDTEPLKRTIKKIMSDSCLSWFLDKDTWLMQQAIAGTSKLKLVCSDPLALREVEKVEKEHFLWNLAKLVGKIALDILVLCVVTLLLGQLTVTAAAPAVVVITALIATALATTIIVLASMKLIGLILSTFDISRIWAYSHMGVDHGGLWRINQMELAGNC